MLLLLLSTPLLPAALGSPPERSPGPGHREAPCAFEPVPGLGDACRVGSMWHVRMADGSTFTTHGFDRRPDVVGASLPPSRAPFCVADPATERHVLLVYARAHDAPDQYADWVLSFRHNFALANGHLHADANMNGPIDVDIRTACTSGAPTVVHRVLPTSKASTSVSTIFWDLQPVAAANPNAKLLVLYDGCLSWCGYGVAAVASDDSLSPSNQNLLPGTIALAIGDTYYGLLLHELLHTLGAVQGSAPSSDGGGHCTQGVDIMCSNGSTPCDPWIVIPQVDCMDDDYCAFRPHHGSYLTTRWNICWRYNSYLQFDGNLAPLVTGLACQAPSVTATSPFRCTWAGADDSFAVRYTLDAGDGTPPVSIPPMGTTTPFAPAAGTLRFMTPGVHTLSVTAIDAHGLQGPASTFTVTVEENDAPTFDHFDCATSQPELGVPTRCDARLADDSPGGHVEIDWGGATTRAPLAGEAPIGTLLSTTHAWEIGGPVTLRARPVDDGLPALVGPEETRSFGVWCGALAHAEGAHAEQGTPLDATFAGSALTWDSRVAPGVAGSSASSSLRGAEVYGIPSYQYDAIGKSIAAWRGVGAGEASSEVQIARIDVGNGLLTLRDLRVIATSRVAGAGPGLVGDAGASGIVHLGAIEVEGIPFPVPAPGVPLRIPGVGTLTLNETLVGLAPQGLGAEALVTGVRIRLDRPDAQGEIAIGRAVARASCLGSFGTEWTPGVSDAGSGRDAGDAPADALLLPGPGVYQGRVVNADTLDHFAILARPGEKVRATLTPAPRAKATLSDGATPLQADPVATPDLTLQLLEPGSLAVRESSALPLGVPERVELNVDVEGAWVLRVQRASGTAGNYTLSVDVTPVALAAQNDAGSGGDAPATCSTSAPRVRGAASGVLRDEDRADVVAVEMRAGELLQVTMKPGEDADGADLDLYLYDPACKLLSQSRLGKPVAGAGTGAKGTPEQAVLSATLDGPYFVEVRRVNGIANWYLHALVLDPRGRM